MKGILILFLLGTIVAPAWYLPGKSRHHYSETGVVYTTSYLTLRLPSGVVGFPPGSRFQSRFDVHLLDKEIVTDGKYTLALDPQTLTHDIEYAEELAVADQQTQDKVYAGAERTRNQVVANRHAAELLTALDIDQVNSSFVASSTMGMAVGNLQRPSSVVGAYVSAGGSSIIYAPASGIVNNVTNISVLRNGGTAGAGAHAGPAAASVSKVSLYGPQPTVDRSNPSLVAQ